MPLLGMDSKKRSAGIEVAEVASIYGISSGLSYDDFVGLWLNIETIRARQAFDMSRAFRVGLGDEGIPDDWIHAATTNPIEASKWKSFDLKRTLNKSRT